MEQGLDEILDSNSKFKRYLVTNRTISISLNVDESVLRDSIVHTKHIWKYYRKLINACSEVAHKHGTQRTCLILEKFLNGRHFTCTFTRHNHANAGNIAIAALLVNEGPVQGLADY